MESDEQQLPLNDIYNWFRDKSSYFRTNSVTWKVLNSTVVKPCPQSPSPKSQIQGTRLTIKSYGPPPTTTTTTPL